MSAARCFGIFILKASIASCVVAFGAAQAADHVIAYSDIDVQRGDRSATAKAYAAVAAPARLDLRVPDLQHVMPHGVLLGEIGSASEDDAQPVEIAAVPELMPMISEQAAPLGLIAAFAWSVDHPTQAWRILLPLPEDSIG